jgi:hypothetical protein
MGEQEGPGGRMDPGRVRMREQMREQQYYYSPSTTTKLVTCTYVVNKLFER